MVSGLVMRYSRPLVCFLDQFRLQDPCIYSLSLGPCGAAVALEHRRLEQGAVRELRSCVHGIFMVVVDSVKCLRGLKTYSVPLRNFI